MPTRAGCWPRCRCPIRAAAAHNRELDDSEVPSPLRRLDDPPVVAPLVEVGPGHFVARHRVGGAVIDEFGDESETDRRSAFPHLALAAALTRCVGPACRPGRGRPGRRVDANLTGLDPYDVNDTLSHSAGRLMFQGLFGFDKDMKIIPVLAESYEASEDATRVHLPSAQGRQVPRRRAFNAAAVKANFDRAGDPANKLKRHSLLR